MTAVQLREIIKYIEEHGYECVLVEKSNASFIFVDVVINGKEMRLKCDFPISFPYDFPKMYILSEFYKSIAPLPHIDDKGYICTFDRNISYPNCDKPNEVILSSIEKAIQIISDGLNGVNRGDFLDEFKAYWAIESEYRITANAIFYPKEEPCHLVYYKDEQLGLHVGENKDQLMEYLKYVKGIDVNPNSLEVCLFLPLNLDWYPPFPKTNKEFYLKVAENPYCFKAYYDFIKNRTTKSLIIFSQIISGNLCLAGWINKPVRTPKGFRKGRIVPELVHLGTSKDNNVIKVDVTQFNHNRLFNRGGDGSLLFNDKVSITGCGSIGSYIIRSLAELGVNKFVLVDKEVLTSENIARHYCGASDIGKFKGEAIKETLIKHYPDIMCESINKNVFQVIENNIEIFNVCEFNFIIVGDKPIETKFIRLINERLITKPVIIIWVEPYLLGGHAIVIQKPQDIEKVVYDTDNNFINNILVDGSKYYKKEAGCQSTFIPYSGFEAQHFIYSLMDYINDNIFTKKIDGNYLFSWCGKLDWARNGKIMISDMWLAKNNRTNIIKRLD